MSDHCTVLGALSDRGESLAAVRAVAHDCTVTIDGEESFWHRITLAGAGGSLTLTAKRPVTPGDDFSRLVLGLHNHFRLAVQRHGGDATVLQQLLRLNVAIGVVAEPSWDAAGWMDQVVFGVAAAVEGMIFDGQSLVAPDGSVLLDSGPAAPR